MRVVLEGTVDATDVCGTAGGFRVGRVGKNSNIIIPTAAHVVSIEKLAVKPTVGDVIDQGELDCGSFPTGSVIRNKAGMSYMRLGGGNGWGSQAGVYGVSDYSMNAAGTSWTVVYLP